MPADIPFSSNARLLDMATRRLAEGMSPEQAAHWIQDTVPGMSARDVRAIVSEAGDVLAFNRAANAGNMDAARAAFEQLVPVYVGETAVLQGIVTINPAVTTPGTAPVPTEAPVQIPIPAGTTLEEALAALQARAAEAAAAGAGHDSVPGGTVAGIRVAGLYRQE